MRSRLLTVSLSLVVALFMGGADGCSSDPNVEGAKLDLNNRDYDAALANLDQALATNPDNADALVLRVEVRRQQYDATSGAGPKAAYLDENYDAIIADAMRAQELAPEDPTVRSAVTNAWILGANAGNNLVRDPEADALDAVPYFEKANRLRPDSTLGYLGLGLAYLRAGEATQALGPLQRGVDLDEDDPTLAYYYGRSLVLAERGTEAVSFLERAQARFPENEDVQTMLLNAYTASGQIEQAVERYSVAAQNRPTDPTIQYNYGALLLQLERYDEAIAQLTRATELDRSNSNAYYNLGAAYQNRAAALNQRGNESEDADEANALFAQRDENLEASLAPLMQARTLSTGTDDEAGVCNALFRVYTQLGRIDNATAVAECAGMATN